MPGSARLRARRTYRLLPAFALMLVIASGRSMAEDRNLKPVYDFVVEIDGVLDKGWQVLAGQQKSRLLLISPPGDQACMVSIVDKSVRPADTSLLLKKDGSVDVLAGCLSATRVIPLTTSGASASFSFDGRTVVLKPRPPLLGPQTVEALVQDRPNFGEGIKSYQPDPDAVAFMKTYPKETEIEIYFGSWCSVCEAWVPRFLKSAQAAGNGKLQIILFGVAHDFATDQALIKEKGIRGLPTFILRQDGIEIGRIVGAPSDGTVEGKIVGILKARLPASASSQGPRGTPNLSGS